MDTVFCSAWRASIPFSFSVLDWGIPPACVQFGLGALSGFEPQMVICMRHNLFPQLEPYVLHNVFRSRSLSVCAP